MKTPAIDRLLERAGRAMLCAELLGLGLRCVYVGVLVFLLVVIFDAGFGLGCYGLLVVDGVLVWVMGVVAWPMVLRVFRGRLGARGVAVAIESRLEVKDNQLVNALDIGRQTADGASESLRNEVIARGEALAEGLRGVGVIDREARGLAVRRAGVAVVVLVVFYLVLPGVFDAVVPRLLVPLGEYPAFTLLSFDVRVEPGRVYYGEGAAVGVGITGPAWLGGPGGPGRAEIVFLDDGERSVPLAMLRVSGASGGETDGVSAQGEGVEFAFRIDRVEGARRFYIQTTQGRSGVHTLEVDRSPLIEGAWIRYRYPAYTGWADWEGALTAGGIKALVGTEVTLKVESNVRVGGGELVVVPEGPSGGTGRRVVSVVPDAVDAHVGVAGFTMDATGGFELSVVGEDGRAGVETLSGGLRALPDRVPRIDIVRPMREVVVPEGWGVEVEVVAGDDIGVGAVTMHHGLNDRPSVAARLEVTHGDGGKTVGYGGHGFDLSAMGAGAGDVVRYYAGVVDNHPGEAQRAETAVHEIRVVTMRRYLDLARQRYRAEDYVQEAGVYQRRLDGLEGQRGEMLEQLEALKTRLDGGGPMSDELRGEMAALELALNEYGERALELKRDLIERSGRVELYGFEGEYKRGLKRIGSGLGRQAGRGGELADAVGALSREDTAGRRAEMDRRAEKFGGLEEPYGEGVMAETGEVLADAGGGDGEGLADELSRMGMVGPAVPEAGGGGAEFEGDGRISRGRGVGDDRGAGSIGMAGGGEQAELLDADTAGAMGYSDAMGLGVPVEYREQVGAYFKRIAEESR